MKNKVCTACLGKRQHSQITGERRSADFPGQSSGSNLEHRMVDCKRCNGTGEEPKANRNDWLKEEKNYSIEDAFAESNPWSQVKTKGLLATFKKYGKLQSYDDKMVTYIYNVVMFNDQRRDTTPEEMIEYPCRIWHIYKRIDQNMNRIDVKYWQRERNMEEHRKLIVWIYYMFVWRHERKLEAQDPTSIHFIYNMIYDHENSKK